jgi:GTP-binding protein YchF
MGFRCGIVGLPNVGKSTLFNALTRTAAAQAQNYPFCTIEPNTGEVAVPDPRLERVAALARSPRVVPTRLTFVDIAGLVRGASRGEGLGNQFLANIRETDAIAHVVRCFVDDNVTHVEGRVDPVADVQTIQTELILRDLDSVTKRLDKARKLAKGNSPIERAAVTLCERLSEHLNAGKLATTFSADGASEEEVLKELQLLTSKRMFYVANVDEASLSALDQNPHLAALRRHAEKEGATVVPICAQLEAQIAELEPGDRPEFLEQAGLKEAGLNQVIRTGYELLGLITYLTAGEKECRAWTIPRGWTAPQAAGVIHTDFERGFIKAEVIDWRDLLHYGSEAKCREAGKARIEGKTYVVQDGDVMHFRFNT